MKNILGKMQKYYVKGGWHGIISFILESMRQRIQNRVVLFCTELAGSNVPQANLPVDIRVERIESIAAIDSVDTKLLFERLGEKVVQRQFVKRFSKGAKLWLIKSQSDILGFSWTIRGVTKDFYYLPLSEWDVFHFDLLMFPEFRGGGIIAAATNAMLQRLAEEGVMRVYGAIKLWNEASLRFVTKTPMRAFGVARKINIFGYEILHFDDLSKYYKVNNLDSIKPH